MRKAQEPELTIEQENAIDLLIAGKRDREAAQAVGVTRQTVNAWRNRDPVFITELNQRRAALWGEDLDRLRGLVGRAVAVLAEDLEGEDPAARRAAAVHILRAVGLYGANAQPNGETSLRRLQLDMAVHGI